MATRGATRTTRPKSGAFRGPPRRLEFFDADVTAVRYAIHPGPRGLRGGVQVRVLAQTACVDAKQPNWKRYGLTPFALVIVHHTPQVGGDGLQEAAGRVVDGNVNDGRDGRAAPLGEGTISAVAIQDRIRVRRTFRIISFSSLATARAL